MVNESDNIWLQQLSLADSCTADLQDTHVGKPFHDIYLVVNFIVDRVVPHEMPLLNLLRCIIFAVSLGRQFEHAGESTPPNLSYYVEPVSAAPFHSVIEFLIGKVPFQMVVVVGWLLVRWQQVLDGVVE